MDIKILHKEIYNILSNPKWTNKEKHMYSIIKKFYDRYYNREIEQSVNLDIKLIKLNLKEYNWYKEFKNKIYLTSILDTMKINKYNEIIDINLSLLNIELKFTNFIIYISYYQNFINKSINFMTFVKIDNKKFFITYYVSSYGLSYNNDIINLNLPQVDMFYKHINLDIKKSELLLCIIEILLYFDKNNLYGSLPISVDSKISLKSIKESTHKRDKENIIL